MFSVVLNRTQKYSENELDFLHVSYFISVILEFVFNMLTHWQLFTIPSKSKFPFQYFYITHRYFDQNDGLILALDAGWEQEAQWLQEQNSLTTEDHSVYRVTWLLSKTYQPKCTIHWLN